SARSTTSRKAPTARSRSSNASCRPRPTACANRGRWSTSGAEGRVPLKEYAASPAAARAVVRRGQHGPATLSARPFGEYARLRPSRPVAARHNARMYHDASRQLQDRFDTRRLADRLAEKLSRTAFTDEDRAFVASQSMFFFATADADGWPECSYKGGVPGFVRVLDAQTLAFPSYDGNGMFRSLGNVVVNPRVGLLFIDFERPRRLRVQGSATLSLQSDELASWPGA